MGVSRGVVIHRRSGGSSEGCLFWGKEMGVSRGEAIHWRSGGSSEGCLFWGEEMGGQ